MNHERSTATNPKYKITAKQLDDMADKLGSYFDAYAHYEVTPEEVAPEEPSEPTVPEITPAAVLLADRAMALMNLSTMYATYARATGLSKAKDIPLHRQELDTRYEDVEFVASSARSNARAGMRREAQLVEPLMQSEALIAAGFDEGDIETEKMRLTYELRQAIGVSKYADDRKKALKNIYTPKQS